MSVPTQAMKSISIPTTNLEVQPLNPIPEALAASSGARARLIEVISRNVMAWTSWAAPERTINTWTNLEELMPGGDKGAYTDKQKRQAEHIEDSYEDRFSII